MRVIAGTAKGITLRSPKGSSIRPATDRVKESLFGTLGDAVCEARVLDLFAGTGSVGIEALSRGAAHCTFVDGNVRCLDAIRQNLGKTGLAGRASVRRGNALRAAKLASPSPDGFDLVFVDPPYALSDVMDERSPIGRLLLEMGEGAFLARGALVVVEHRTSSAAPDEIGALALSDRRRYGGTTISIYEKAAEGEQTTEAQRHGEGKDRQ